MLLCQATLASGGKGRLAVGAWEAVRWSARRAVNTTSDRRRRSSRSASVLSLPRPTLLVQVRLSGADAAGLGHRDHVQRAVHGAVAAAVEPDLAVAGARPHRDRCGAGEAGEGVLVAEAVHSGGLADDDCRRQDAAAGDSQQAGASRGPACAARPRAALICWLSSSQRDSGSRASRATTPSTRSSSATEPRRPRSGAAARGRGTPASGSSSCRCQRSRLCDPGALDDQVAPVIGRAASPRAPDRRARRPAGPGWRSAASATASASIGSDLPGSRPARRAPAISRVGTRTTRQPAPSRSRSRRRVRCRQSSNAKATSSNCADQRTSSRCPSPLVRTRLRSQPAADVVERDDGVGALVGIGADHDHAEATPHAR